MSPAPSSSLRSSTTSTVALLTLSLALVGCPNPPDEVVDDGASPTSTGPSGSSGPFPTNPTQAATSTGPSNESSTTDAVDTTMGVQDTTSGSSGPEPTSSSGGSSESTGAEICHPLIVEVIYNPGGGDNNKEWVKLYNPCPEDHDLMEYSLGWAGADYTAGQMDLAGIIPADGCYVIGGPTSDGNNANPTYDLAQDFARDLFNLDDPGSGLALFSGPAAMVDATTVPLDAVIYGLNNDAGLLDSTGAVGAVDVADAGSGNSIRRDTPDSWIVEMAPMPDVCPPY